MGMGVIVSCKAGKKIAQGARDKRGPLKYCQMMNWRAEGSINNKQGQILRS